MKIFKRIIIILVIILVIFFIIGIIYLTQGLNEGSQLSISKLDLTNVEDGTYYGEYIGTRWSNQVKVTVKDNLINQIEILKDVKFVQEGLSEELFGYVINEQNVNIDSISGATVTSKAYLKAVENAFLIQQ